jgi:UDP-N-acetylmuramyl pentapeptide phosphotransferase/UDP-N-acetylglucosamine-1-phosphate transferase
MRAAALLLARRVRKYVLTGISLNFISRRKIASLSGIKGSLLIFVLLVTFIGMAVNNYRQQYFPLVVAQIGSELELTFLLDDQVSDAECEKARNSVVSTLKLSCLTCQIERTACLSKLDSRQQQFLMANPLDLPSARLSNGVVVFSATNQEAALATCQESARQAPLTTGFKCFPAHSIRSVPAAKPGVGWLQMFFGLLTLVAAGLAAWTVCWLVIRYEHLHAHLSHDHLSLSPQKFHVVPTPRIGGVGLFAGLLSAGGILLVVNPAAETTGFGHLLLASVPAFLGGLTEDITKKVNVKTRLMLTMLSGAFAAWLLQAVLDRLAIPGFDQLLASTMFSVCFTVFAVSGVANAVNIIDGYNGLATGYGLLVLAAMAWVAAQVGDSLVFTAASGIGGALFGFGGWNYPLGKIFLGDGGAYLLGFWLAELSVLLVVRNPEVSPWFPLLLLVYPIFETLFSVYRKKWLRGHSPGRPDGLHLHMLIYKRLVRTAIGSKDPEQVGRRNNAVAPYIWSGTAFVIVPSLFFWSDSEVLAVLCLGFCLVYVLLYRSLISWNSPRWLIYRKTPPSRPGRSRSL